MRRELLRSLPFLGGVVGIAVGLVVFYGSGFRTGRIADRRESPAVLVLGGSDGGGGAPEQVASPVISDRGLAVQNVAAAYLNAGQGRDAATLLNSHLDGADRVGVANEIIFNEYKALEVRIPDDAGIGSAYPPLEPKLGLERLKNLKMFVDEVEAPIVRAKGYAKLVELRRRFDRDANYTHEEPTVSALLDDAKTQLGQMEPTQRTLGFARWLTWLGPLLLTGLTGLIGVAGTKLTESVVVEIGKQWARQGRDPGEGEGESKAEPPATGKGGQSSKS